MHGYGSNILVFFFKTAASFIDKMCSTVTEAKREAILFFSVCSEVNSKYYPRASQSECAESTIHSCGVIKILIGQMAIGLNDLKRSVTPIFLSMGHFL